MTLGLSAVSLDDDPCGATVAVLFEVLLGTIAAPFLVKVFAVCSWCML